MKQSQTIHSYPGQPASDEIAIQKSQKPEPPMPKYGKASLVAQFRQELQAANPSPPICAPVANTGCGHQ
jgi:hypothetical protein